MLDKLIENEIITEEMLEQTLDEYERKTKLLGFMNVEHYLDFKYHAAEGLKKYGDNFQQALGKLLLLASDNNSIKIIRYWHQECEQHAILHRMYKAKEKETTNNE